MCRELCCVGSVFLFQAEDGIRDLVRSRGLGDVYKRQMRVCAHLDIPFLMFDFSHDYEKLVAEKFINDYKNGLTPCLLYTSDAADERSSVDLGGRRIIKKKKKID